MVGCCSSLKVNRRVSSGRAFVHNWWRYYDQMSSMTSRSCLVGNIRVKKAGMMALW